jgi:hypothetical protein
MMPFKFAVRAAFVVAVLANSTGCELFAEVDRSRISSSDGQGGSGGGSASASSGTSGRSGSSGHSGSSGSGGNSGNSQGTACVLPIDCPASANECRERTCDRGTCGEKSKDAGTPTGTQTAGDCQKSQCNGAGKIVEVDDDGDVPDDGNDCTNDLCTNGAPTNPLVEPNTACGIDGALKCDDTGRCVGCLLASDCAGKDSECQVRSCRDNTCGVDNTPKGSRVLGQTAGDCKASQCDGKGGTQIVNDDGDLPNDGNDCTDDVCTNGVPKNPGKALNTACGVNNALKCDGAAKCVACLVASDCPGQDSECLRRACDAGVCGTTPTALGTPVTSQTVGDCKLVVCDGAGSTTAQNADLDPANDNNSCTNDLCTAGMPMHPQVSEGAPCGASGACLQGACTGCGAPSDCPGVDDECKSRTCSVGVCGFAFTPSGTAAAAQIPGNCQKRQCDGSGNTISAEDNTDAPADDGNQCTSEVCVAGVPLHPAKAVDTACSQNGGTVCSASALCAECNAAVHCPGTDTECHARTCNGNACGQSNVAAGTPTSTQTAGDCQKIQCDGTGNIVASSDDSDAPADDGNQCTSELCTAGVPSHPAKAIDTLCSQSGGIRCDGAGACVPASCSDGFHNGDETDVDCGGVTCGPCPTNGGCSQNSDCQSSVCTGNICADV